ncbi:hypothetical protein OsJ_24950 [Oryza sativa Japonica Group]|uniref:Uncharacterized protein n=1 Tax=Oryza sativa subsp. japonica TaxID=39947 RepID=B9FY71_ORYSJ|nr:hypothetical protein OsJ_24950 [Oryza sativa Japonica Group]
METDEPATKAAGGEPKPSPATKAAGEQEEDDEEESSGGGGTEPEVKQKQVMPHKGTDKMIVLELYPCWFQNRVFLWTNFELVKEHAAVFVASGDSGPSFFRRKDTGFRVFRALGGHKRFHYLHGPSVSATVSSAATAASVGAAFDLNVAPIKEIAGEQRRCGEEADDDDEAESPSPAKKPRRRPG